MGSVSDDQRPRQSRLITPPEPIIFTMCYNQSSVSITQSILSQINPTTDCNQQVCQYSFNHISAGSN